MEKPLIKAGFSRPKDVKNFISNLRNIELPRSDGWIGGKYHDAKNLAACLFVYDVKLQLAA